NEKSTLRPRGPDRDTDLKDNLTLEIASAFSRVGFPVMIGFETD
ncbi:MAG: hypothetical protein JWM11_2215, partial [Planctomycetaceae bacterium]|nr:hypothetical protein [Planctomycetaceae bacterium]